MHEALFQWQGREYAFEERGPDWYWALGIVSVAAAITCVLFANYLLALVILVGAATVGLQAAKHHRDHTFSLYEDGLAIDDNLYLFKDMRDFAVLEYLDPSLPPALSIKTNHILSPHILVPINDHDPLDIYEYVLRHVPEGEHHMTLLDRIVTFLKF